MDDHWLGNVLESLLSTRLEAQRHLVPDVINHGPRNANASSLGQLLEPGGDIDGIAVPVVAFNDNIPKMYTHPNDDAFAVGNAFSAFGHPTLEGNRTFHSINNAGEFGEQPVTHQLEDAAEMLLDFGFEQLLTVGSQPLKCRRFGLLHEAAIANHVSGKNSGEMALGAFFGHFGAAALRELIAHNLLVTARGVYRVIFRHLILRNRSEWRSRDVQFEFQYWIAVDPNRTPGWISTGNSASSHSDVHRRGWLHDNLRGNRRRSHL
jgi:hypothetical protein